LDLSCSLISPPLLQAPAYDRRHGSHLVRIIEKTGTLFKLKNSNKSDKEKQHYQKTSAQNGKQETKKDRQQTILKVAETGLEPVTYGL
jgi:hypothetical protein